MKTILPSPGSHLGVAGDAPGVPAGQICDGFGVHVGLLGGGVDAPHVDHARDLAHPETEGGAAHHVLQPAVLSGESLDLARHLEQKEEVVRNAKYRTTGLTIWSAVSEWPSLP